MPTDPWLTRLRIATLRFRNPMSVNSLSVLPELSSGVIPEPDEELPDSDLDDGERRAAMARELWRRESGR